MNKKLEEHLKKELGEAYLNNDERFVLGRNIDIGKYDDTGILIGFKEGEDEE